MEYANTQDKALYFQLGSVDSKMRVSSILNRKVVYIIAIGTIIIILLAATLSFFKTTAIPPTVGLKIPSVRSTSGGTKKGLIVFIHGWNGDPNNTWERFPALFESDQRFSGFGVLSIGYQPLCFDEI
jgi:hypothetical protein